VLLVGIARLLDTADYFATIWMTTDEWDTKAILDLLDRWFNTQHQPQKQCEHS
jgi:hypothetical protein